MQGVLKIKTKNASEKMQGVFSLPMQFFLFTAMPIGVMGTIV